MCDCINKMNERLREHNAVMVSTLFSARKAVISTERIDSKKRGRPPVVIATFCPFCAERYEAPGHA